MSKSTETVTENPAPELFAFDNSYARLPGRFYARVAPTKVGGPRVVRINQPLAELLGASPELLASSLGAALLVGNELPRGAEPLALAYAGHQFGGFVSQLGDGRAILLGEVVGKDGQRRDIQLKGSGRTPFSRGGDGRAALGPVLREYLVSEAMAALRIPTTRALAVATTGERVLREEALPGAILTRVAASHLRVGTFEFFAARGDLEALVALTAHALARHYPQAAGSGNDALALLEQVIDAQANLVARWLGVGFVHGVMNTDNTAISGETLDYGPCAFLDQYDPGRTFSSIDHQGRYAFSNQPRIAHWNMARLAEALLGLMSRDEEEAVRLAKERLERFPARFEAAHLRVLRAKLGLAPDDLSTDASDAADADDRALAYDLLGRLAENHVDFTLFFRRLCASAADPSADGDILPMFDNPDAFLTWAETWRRRLDTKAVTPEARASAMRRTNPAFIPRNHRVEEAIEAAVRRDDFGPFQVLADVLTRPFDDQPELAHLADPPGADQRMYRTFCGT
ncbi:MAG TPA: YdiU family protein [Polyangia bacterium]|nr:YdiU family protein [Polyangia bacterium]